MNTLLLLGLFYYTLSLNDNYYQKCLSGIDNIDIISVSECRKYDPDGGYCCYLHYENKKKAVDIYVPPTYDYKKKENKTSTNFRKLGEPLNYCYGLSKNGYDNINNVIDELKKESGVEELSINCNQIRLKNSLLNIFGLLLILIII